MDESKNKSNIHKIRHVAFSYFGTHFIKYNLVGVFGVVLNLAATFALTEFLLGRPNYIYAFIIGNVINIFYNYVTYIKYIFPTHRLGMNRKIVFFAYSSSIALAQIILSDVLVSIVGINLYLPVLALVIGVISVISFFIFKSHIFVS